MAFGPAPKGEFGTYESDLIWYNTEPQPTYRAAKHAATLTGREQVDAVAALLPGATPNQLISQEMGYAYVSRGDFIRKSVGMARLAQRQGYPEPTHDPDNRNSVDIMLSALWTVNHVSH